jgi:hypothetical protein
MNHLYESGDGMIHSCEGGQIANDRSTYVVWTRCGKDVPANMSFRADISPTCKKCLDSAYGTDASETQADSK